MITEHEIARMFVFNAIWAAQTAFESACYWHGKCDTEVVKMLMVEYHCHAKIAYALNEQFGAGVDVYGKLHAF